jgi:hypothetical protein
MQDADRQRVSLLIREWCRRRRLHLEAACALIGLPYHTFRHRYIDLNRANKADPQEAIAITAFFAEGAKAEQRCKAAEALEFLHLVGVHPEHFVRLKELFPATEWRDAWNRYLYDHGLVPEHDVPDARVVEEDSVALINEGLAMAYWSNRTFEHYVILRNLGTVLAGAPPDRKTDEEKITWFSYLVRMFVHLDDYSQLLGPFERKNLLNVLERAWLQFEDKLWALEWRAFYLEMLGKFRAAALVSEEVACFAAANSKPELFVAALHARTAHCLKHAGDWRQAAQFFACAADVMAGAGRLSIQAAAYYRAALSLDRTTLTPERAGALERLQHTLDDVMRQNRLLVGIVANQFDIDFADELVHPLFMRGAACCFEPSANVPDLLDLCARYDACIVVGGIKALATDRHVHRHFYQALSLKERHTFAELDIKGQHYCDYWHSAVGAMPTYVLAGLTREETCQAILSFAASEEIDTFIGLANKNHTNKLITHKAQARDVLGE